MLSDEHGQETEGENSQDKSPILNRDVSQQVPPNYSLQEARRRDEEAVVEGEAAVREALREVTESSKEKEIPQDQWGKEYERTFDRTEQLTLDIFNERILKQKGREPLTSEQFENMEKAKLSAFFKDTESGQKWELILQRTPLFYDEKTQQPVTRIKIFDFSPRGKRILHEWEYGQLPNHRTGKYADSSIPETQAEWEKEYGDVYHVGWWITRSLITDFDSRTNANPHIPFLREGAQAQWGMDTDGLNRINGLLERTLKHPEVVKSSWHKMRLPPQ